MRRVSITVAALLATTSLAHAGGIDRSGQGVNILFEEGNYVQFTFANINPSVDGKADITAGGGSVIVGSTSASDVAQTYNQLSFGYKHELNENWDLAVIVDQPFGAHVLYADGPFSNIGSGGALPYDAEADIDSRAITMLAQYNVGNGFSIHGGLRGLSVNGIIQSGDGILDADSDYNWGGVVGVAYERPDIALRVALTYATATNVDFDGTMSQLVAPGTLAPSMPTDFTVEFPESVNLDFQTGVAPDTLLFGSVRWVGWGGFNLTTPGLAGDIEWVNFDDDTITYRLGIGRRLNEEWSVALVAGYESAGTRPSTTALAPTTGSKSIGIAATYTSPKNWVVSGGLEYVVPGDQYVTFAGPAGTDPVQKLEFNDNSAIAAGIRIGYRF
ncbi:Outer membrane protein transport protein (OMPP1/FadL/TodX) [Pseudoruegeria aquimaris]|uniref:Outer membrane protein transport protein (OMPP1/FadL/TodX) n=1 Tax=Pseudoruegeria aquimaris TaxID=393663 RepID=A0A1Y5RKM1_9RHOB|nr:outer membrane protein transport protein [Pseudoruegeria aquimaris]SLN18595.1 Outer membrane protein transport protein (OMPP1/FadL/TodX) [Pseudoruegeria aquimaris]